jgi:hypothetical protein
MAAVQIGTHKPIGNHPLSNTALVIICVISIIVGVFLSTQKLKTTITIQEIKYSFGLFAGESIISINNIKSITIRKYDGLKEFLGWGVRSNSKEDCYTVSGNIGLEIILLNSSRKILIGTQRRADLQLILQTHFQDKLQQSDENKS